MKKTFLIMCIAFAPTFLKAQSLINTTHQKFKILYSVGGNIYAVDTSYHTIDTVYSTSQTGTTLYRTVRARFALADKPTIIYLYHLKQVFTNNKNWEFYSSNIEPYLNTKDYPGIILNNRLFANPFNNN